MASISNIYLDLMVNHSVFDAFLNSPLCVLIRQEMASASVGSFYLDLMENRSDPRVHQWRFMGSPGPTLYIIAAYLALVLLVLPAYMRNRKPFDLTKIIRVYNISQVLACCALIYMFLSAGWLQGDYSFGCQPIDYSNNQKAVQLVTAFWWIYILKQVELVETIFFVLRKKFNQVSALHIYHHASSLFIAYIGCKFIGGGMFAIPVMMNLFIHVMMYTYYYLSSLGPQWQKKLAVWKPKLTIAQMVNPRVQHWTLMASPLPTLMIAALYLLTVLVVLPIYMKNRKPYKLTTIIRYYNIFQILSCIYIIYVISTAGWLQGELSLGCQPVDYSNTPTALQMASGFYYIYLLKMVELIETVFFCLRKKFNQVTGLHIYHHASTFCLTYIGCRFVAGGMASVPLVVNSFIHILMYAYYYMSSFGPSWQKKLAPWKPKLTMLQMVQFTLLIIHALTSLTPNCQVPRTLLMIYIPNVVVIFKMFYDFYQKSYSTKQQDKVTRKAKNNHKKSSAKAA
nr:unnamed protein product [Callosobruchus chinensis]